jgi:hypothetical protein
MEEAPGAMITSLTSQNQRDVDQRIADCRPGEVCCGSLQTQERPEQQGREALLSYIQPADEDRRVRSA